MDASDLKEHHKRAAKARKPGSGGARKGAGRPPKAPEDRTQNTERVTVFLSVPEQQKLDQLCAWAKLSRADLMRIGMNAVHETLRSELQAMAKAVAK